MSCSGPPEVNWLNTTVFGKHRNGPRQPATSSCPTIPIKKETHHAVTEVADLQAIAEVTDAPPSTPATLATALKRQRNYHSDGSSSSKGTEGLPWRLAGRGRGSRCREGTHLTGPPSGSGSYPRTVCVRMGLLSSSRRQRHRRCAAGNLVIASPMHVMPGYGRYVWKSSRHPEACGASKSGTSFRCNLSASQCRERSGLRWLGLRGNIERVWRSSYCSWWQGGGQRFFGQVPSLKRRRCSRQDRLANACRSRPTKPGGPGRPTIQKQDRPRNMNSVVRDQQRAKLHTGSYSAFTGCKSGILSATAAGRYICLTAGAVEGTLLRDHQRSRWRGQEGSCSRVSSAGLRPISGPGGDSSNAKVFTRLKRGDSRMKIIGSHSRRPSEEAEHHHQVSSPSCPLPCSP